MRCPWLLLAMIACKSTDHVGMDDPKPVTIATTSSVTIATTAAVVAEAAPSAKRGPDDCRPRYAAPAALDRSCLDYCSGDRTCEAGAACKRASWVDTLGDAYNAYVCVPSGVAARPPAKDGRVDGRQPWQLQYEPQPPPAKMPKCAASETLVGEDNKPPFCRHECKSDADCPRSHCDTSTLVFYVDDATGELQHGIGGIYVCAR